MKIDMRAWNAKAQRTRRNVLKMGVVFGLQRSQASSRLAVRSVPRHPMRQSDKLRLQFSCSRGVLKNEVF